MCWRTHPLWMSPVGCLMNSPVAYLSLQAAACSHWLLTLNQWSFSNTAGTSQWDSTTRFIMYDLVLWYTLPYVSPFAADCLNVSFLFIFCLNLDFGLKKHWFVLCDLVISLQQIPSLNRVYSPQRKMLRMDQCTDKITEGAQKNRFIHRLTDFIYMCLPWVQSRIERSLLLMIRAGPPLPTTTHICPKDNTVK